MSILKNIVIIFFFLGAGQLSYLLGMFLIIDALELPVTLINQAFVCGNIVIFMLWGYFEYHKTVDPLKNEICSDLSNYISKFYKTED